MMYRSDNFYAEQTLLMASNEHLGFMNEGTDDPITLLKQDLKTSPETKNGWMEAALSQVQSCLPRKALYIY